LRRIRFSVLQRLTAELEAFARGSRQVAVVGPTDRRLFYGRRAPLVVELKGFPCRMEAAGGALSVLSEHRLHIRCDGGYPARQGDLRIFYDYRSRGAVPFHPNVAALHQAPVATARGYVCLWEPPPAGTRLVDMVQRAVEMMALRAVNPEPPHSRLNPRARDAWLAGGLTPLFTHRLVGGRPPRRAAV